jgi:hypothetical protein
MIRRVRADLTGGRNLEISVTTLLSIALALTWTPGHWRCS